MVVHANSTRLRGQAGALDGRNGQVPGLASGKFGRVLEAQQVLKLEGEVVLVEAGGHNRIAGELGAFAGLALDGRVQFQGRATGLAGDLAARAAGVEFLAIGRDGGQIFALVAAAVRLRQRPPYAVSHQRTGRRHVDAGQLVAGHLLLGDGRIEVSQGQHRYVGGPVTFRVLEVGGATFVVVQLELGTQQQQQRAQHRRALFVNISNLAQRFACLFAERELLPGVDDLPLHKFEHRLLHLVGHLERTGQCVARARLTGRGIAQASVLARCQGQRGGAWQRAAGGVRQDEGRLQRVEFDQAQVGAGVEHFQPAAGQGPHCRAGHGRFGRRPRGLAPLSQAGHQDRGRQHVLAIADLGQQGGQLLRRIRIAAARGSRQFGHQVNVDFGIDQHERVRESNNLPVDRHKWKPAAAQELGRGGQGGALVGAVDQGHQGYGGLSTIGRQVGANRRDFVGRQHRLVGQRRRGSRCALRGVRLSRGRRGRGTGHDGGSRDRRWARWAAPQQIAGQAGEQHNTQCDGLAIMQPGRLPPSLDRARKQRIFIPEWHRASSKHNLPAFRVITTCSIR